MGRAICQMKHHPGKAERAACAKGQAGHCSPLGSAWAWGGQAVRGSGPGGQGSWARGAGTAFEPRAHGRVLGSEVPGGGQAVGLSAVRGEDQRGPRPWLPRFPSARLRSAPLGAATGCPGPGSCARPPSSGVGPLGSGGR